MEQLKGSILGLIKDRRSTRRFKPDLISDNDLLAVLDAARWAPSGENVQPWRFLIVKNNEVMHKIVDFLPYKKFQAFLRNAPVLIIVLVNKRKSQWVFQDGALCMQNLMLEAWARGLGTCYSAWYPTVPPEVEENVRTLLKIPKKWKILTMTPLGYPVDDPKRAHILPPRREDLNDLICYEEFTKPPKKKKS
jgi:nitroreductase